MADKHQQRQRRRRLFGAGVRSVGRGMLHSMPGYDRAKSWQKTGEDWFDTLGGLKGAAMKLGQIASQYSDFLPEQLAEQLARLQRDAEPWAFERLEPVLAEQWSDTQRARFETIDEEALAAASIGQVHAARLTDGREVVVKIRYPGVADAVDADIANLARLLKLSRFLPARGKDIDAVLDELRERFIEETDYRHELENLQALRKVDLRGQILPQPIPELCTEAVLVTTRIDAARIDSAPPTLGPVIVESIASQVLTYGLLHADPHPGNFGITENGELAVYDFGCVKYFDHRTRVLLREAIAAGLDAHWHDLHRTLEQLGVVPQNSWAAHGVLYTEIYARHTATILDLLHERQPYVFADDGFINALHADVRQSLRHWKLFNAAPDLVFLMRTLSGLYWILRRVEAEADVLAELEAIADGDYGPDAPDNGGCNTRKAKRSVC